jgi:type VI secretion system protein ImpM
MSTVPEAGQVIYFGKLPTRGDFVKSRNGSRVLDMLDAWITHGLERLSTDPAWKTQYDNSPQIDFSFLATHKPFVLTGRLTPSADSSQRRFPFIAAAASMSDDPLHLVARSPLCLEGTWRTIEHMVASVLSAEDPRDALEAMTASPLSPESNSTDADLMFADFTARTSIAQVEQSLRAAGHMVSLRRMILSLGLLLTPVLTTPGAKPDKGLSLPLPAEPELAANVGAMWMNFIAPFLARGDFELGLFVQHKKERPTLVLVFDGANAGALRAMFDSQDENGVLIDVSAADWVEDYVENDFAIKKLSSYLEMPPLSIRQATDTFREAFLGA